MSTDRQAGEAFNVEQVLLKVAATNSSLLAWGLFKLLLADSDTQRETAVQLAIVASRIEVDDEEKT